MAKGSITSKQLMTPVFRVAFPNVFTPNDKQKYGVTMLFDKQNFNGTWLQEIVKEIMDQVQTEVFKGQPIPQGVRLNPLKDGDVPNTEGKIHFPGYYYINTSTKFQPGVVDAYLDPATGQLKVITDPREFYPGCYARAKVHAFWYNTDGNKGISLSIGNIQKVKDGEPMGGGRPATQDFDAYDEPPTADYSGMPQYQQHGGAYAQPPAGMALAPQQYVQPQPPHSIASQPNPNYPQQNYAPQPQYNAPPVYPQPQPVYGPAPQQNIMDI